MSEISVYSGLILFQAKILSSINDGKTDMKEREREVNSDLLQQ